MRKGVKLQDYKTCEIIFTKYKYKYKTRLFLIVSAKVITVANSLR